MMNSVKPMKPEASTAVFYERRDQWPSTPFPPLPSLRVPSGFRWAGRFLSLTRLVPPLSHSLPYHWFFRISSRARMRDHDAFIGLNAKARWVTLETHDGTESKRVRCYSLGEPQAPTVLLFHGWETNAESLKPLAQGLLEEGFRVLAFDLPAHGWSQGRHTDLVEINAVAAALLSGQDRAKCRAGQNSAADLHCAAVVAHSFGGVCAARFLADGCRCNSLVLINTPATFHGVFDKFTHLLSLTGQQAISVKNRIRQRFQRFYPDVWRDFSTVNNIAGLAQDLLLVQDMHDKVVPIEEAQTLFDRAKRRPEGRAQILITQGMGHNRLMHEVRVTRAITEFLLETAIDRQDVGAGAPIGARAS